MGDDARRDAAEPRRAPSLSVHHSATGNVYSLAEPLSRLLLISGYEMAEKGASI